MSESTLHIAADHPAFQGHFPGNPLLPGVSLLAEVIEAALTQPELAAIVGRRPRIGVAKFLAPVLPGANLRIVLLPKGQRLQFDAWQGERLTASGHFEAAADSDTA